mgnify:CR=1 FL=1
MLEPVALACASSTCPKLSLTFCSLRATSWFSRRRGSCHLVHGVYGYYVCSVSERVMGSVLAICRCIAPCARCQDLFNPKKHTRVQMPRDEFSKLWRGNSLEARKKAREKKRKFPIFFKLGGIGMCFCLNSLLNIFDVFVVAEVALLSSLLVLISWKNAEEKRRKRGRKFNKN